MKKSLQILIVLALILLLIAWRAAQDVTQSLTAGKLSLQEWFWHQWAVTSMSTPLLDSRSLYGDGSQDASVRTIYLVVLPTVDAAGQVQTFADLNDISNYHLEKPELNAFFLDGGDSGPDVIEGLLAAAGSLDANARVTLRGHSTIASPTKSYKIKLNKTTTAWLGQMTLNLNKHPDDESRMRNKIAFDLFRLIPHLTSMQTQFVRLYVKDLSAGGSAGFRDYGLFTHIEQANEQFLKAHGLDTYGNLYKANFFEFQRYADSLKDVNDPAYNETAFERYLEICAGTSHAKFLTMLDAVNNPSLDADIVLDRYFNRDNYFTWLAVNILLGNYDTQTQNFYLYNPHDSNTWYFLPWDFDGSMFNRIKNDTTGQPAQLVGIANYWNNMLHSRVFREPHNLEELEKRIDEVYQILGSGAISRIVEKYRPVIEKYYLASPVFGKEFTSDEFYDNIEYIKTVAETNYKLFHTTLEKPMPIFLGDAVNDKTGTLFTWSESYDLQGDRISYSLQISRDSSFKDLVFEKNRLTAIRFIVDLEPGTYYWRVVVSDSKGHTQRAFDVFWEDGVLRIFRNGIYGVKKITVDQ